MRDTSFSFLFHSILLRSLLFPHFSETVSLFFRLSGRAVPKQLTRWGHEARRSHRALSAMHGQWTGLCDGTLWKDANRNTPTGIATPQ